MLRTFAVGLAAVCLWQALSLAWWGVPVNLPEAQSGNILEVAIPSEKKQIGSKYLCDELIDLSERSTCLHHVIYQDREMTTYIDGGQRGCGLERQAIDPTACERSLEKARRFIWNHWTKRNRAHVAVTKTFNKTDFETHLFVEPTSEGSWRVVERTIPMLREPEDPDHYWLGDLIEIKWYRATDEDKGLSPGVRYLELSNITGDSLIL